MDLDADLATIASEGFNWRWGALSTSQGSLVEPSLGYEPRFTGEGRGAGGGHERAWRDCGDRDGHP